MKTEITQQQVYDMALKAFGIVPGIVKELALRSESVAFIFTQGSSVMEGGAFTFTELNIIELKISLLNNCTSCIKGHTYLLKKEGLSEDQIKAIIENKTLENERFNHLINATENIYYAGSNVFPDYIVEALQDNLSEKEIVEIIGVIGVKTIANYTNNFIEAMNAMKR